MFLKQFQLLQAGGAQKYPKKQSKSMKQLLHIAQAVVEVLHQNTRSVLVVAVARFLVIKEKEIEEN